MLTEKELIDKWFVHKNAISGRYYRWLTNQETLNSLWFNKCEWLTFHQAKQNWLKVKAWSKWVVVQYKEFVELKEKRHDWGVDIKKIPYVKSWLVFNIEQTEPIKVV